MTNLWKIFGIDKITINRLKLVDSFARSLISLLICTFLSPIERYTELQRIVIINTAKNRAKIVNRCENVAVKSSGDKESIRDAWFVRCLSILILTWREEGGGGGGFVSIVDFINLVDFSYIHSRILRYMLCHFSSMYVVGSVDCRIAAQPR